MSVETLDLAIHLNKLTTRFDDLKTLIILYNEKQNLGTTKAVLDSLKNLKRIGICTPEMEAYIQKFQKAYDDLWAPRKVM